VYEVTIAEGTNEDIFLVEESFTDGEGVITVVASIKPWCQEWAAYWRASVGETTGERFDNCRRHGNKLDVKVAQAIFPHIETQYGVGWRR
jgi:hypothetical protein